MPLFFKSCGKWSSRSYHFASLLQTPPIPPASAVNSPIATALNLLGLAPLRVGEKSHG